MSLATERVQEGRIKAYEAEIKEVQEFYDSLDDSQTESNEYWKKKLDDLNEALQFVKSLDSK